jgi:uncharacterized protein (DUF2062 family)
MADLWNLAMLICACIGSLVLGLLTAYGILRTGFALMRPRQRRMAVKTQPQAASAS